ncbi:hypothetical protein [Umezawaea sp. Da 62-37]|uniref:hypothetical protein n=1 Tax=Umezawaea sp. Da 62-37 TaxID=3075927 RepID=UPI0028F6F5E7|nr:hypothetical protein [Umezawaea sp. Da 62-37]WNV85391.1 hypothetical protein RM788_45950 [Umezawaea sp. Da 62-37]
MSRAVRIAIVAGPVAALVLGILVPSVLEGGFSVNTTAMTVVVVGTVLAAGLFGDSKT